MYNLILLFALLFNSTILLAKSSGNCVFVIMGGSKDWKSLLPGIPTDISIDVDAAVKKEAAKSGCQIISMANDNEANFLKNLKSLSKVSPGTTFHLAFTDHGAPADQNVNKSVVVTGKQQYTTYQKLLNALKENIPKGSHVTFQTNMCWPHVSEAIIANNLESHFEMCGGSSTSSKQMSWNRHDLSINMNGEVAGPYGAVGLNFANEFKEKNGRAPSMTDFHYHAKKGDLGNLSRQPGLTTSLSFANNTLLLKKQISPLVGSDMNELLLEINWKNDAALDNFLNSSNKKIVEFTETHINGTCLNFAKTPYDSFIKKIAPVYYNLINSNFDTLPAPYGVQSKLAKDWLLKNQKNLTKIISSIAIEKAEFVKKNQHFPKEKYPEVEAQWNKLQDKYSTKLRDYEFNLRVLQEGKVVQDFMNNSTAEEKTRFQKFVDCESKPIF